MSINLASEIMRQLVNIRNRCYDRNILRSHRLPGRVISVGNISVGGTGKSPTVQAIASFLKSHGLSPAILTRGYKSGLGSFESMVLIGDRVLLSPPDGRGVYADEARMQAHNLRDVPVIVGAHRIRAAKRYMKFFPRPSHWILDDGFQHRAIKRDLDLCLLSEPQSLRQDHLLPLGRLREPFEALHRAQALLYTKGLRADTELASLKALYPEARPDALHSILGLETTKPFKMWGLGPVDLGKTPSLLTLGVARPEDIIDTLRAKGVEIFRSKLFSDHGLIKLGQADLRDIQAIVTSTKDWHRDPEVFKKSGLPIYLVDLKVKLPDVLKDLLRSKD